MSKKYPEELDGFTIIDLSSDYCRFSGKSYVELTNAKDFRRFCNANMIQVVFYFKDMLQEKAFVLYQGFTVSISFDMLERV